MRLGDLGRALGEKRGGRDVRGQVLQIARRVGRLGGHPRMLELPLRHPRARHLERLDSVPVVVARLEAVELVEAQERALDERAGNAVDDRGRPGD